MSNLYVIYIQMLQYPTSATEPGAQYRVRNTSATSGVSSGAASHSEGSEPEVTAADMGACFDVSLIPSRRES